ncbi:hypothetical protein PRZ48_002997 [Zasmidium cellare]|uniref:Site-specific DNA-methyltransferase (adenine-specific) n=1 Tax=Zasmidium cellare TaxID=395010 RepID=A0ABR0EUF3_ZASCE|nr:hypothetical protein PRZ48_002997 [Zasmidium cellare]
MPRIKPKDILRARAISDALVSLLPACRDLRSAQNELRWMRQHAIKVSQRARVDQNHVLDGYVARRSQGEPLQYILGSEYFGNLEIKCRPGVLIPRFNADTPLELVGVDVSSNALSLARENLIYQMAEHRRLTNASPQQTKSLNSIGFVQADVLRDGTEVENPSPTLSDALERLRDDSDSSNFDILISNPPYISPRGFQRTTSRSVREYEPKLALVPSGAQNDDDEAVGDLFYPKLLNIAEQVNAKTFLFEVSDLDQAKRVAAMASAQESWQRIEIWRDEPDVESIEEIELHGRTVSVRGRGHGRSVFALYGGLDGSSRINEFEEIFTADGVLKVQGKIFHGTKEILQGQTLATAGGSWKHAIDTLYPFGSGDEIEWLMINLQVEMTPLGEGRPKREFESAARIQVAPEAGQVRVKYLQVYTYIPENKARLA